ncbi:MAG: hypothetical protein EHM24_00010 [Acidobacteria bacterium]|nr:MAG: hypothetical protein EHM24_00010 [Acidobacteriota bacterium]
MSTPDEHLPGVVDGDDLQAWIDGRLDAATDRVRYWRYRVLGGDPSTIVSQLPGRRRVSMEVPLGEFVILRDHAKRRDLTVVRFMRAATAYALMMEGVPPEQREWLGHYGIWAPEEAP